MDITERVISSCIEKADEGTRLDIWLSKRFTYQSRNQWQQYIENGKILLDGVKTRSSRKLISGEEVSFVIDRAEPEIDPSYEVVFEDEHFLLVNKSGRMPCHPAGAFYKNTLWYLLTLKYGKVYMSNRLDRETSGLVIVSKNPRAAQLISDMIASKDEITKKYIAIVHGNFGHSPLRADGFLVPDTNSIVMKKRAFFLKDKLPQDLSSDAESAETILTGKAFSDGLSVVEASPLTGRLHQIRATLYSLGYPLVGDKIYGVDENLYLKFADDTISEEEKKKLILPRQALHAYYLAFKHPVTGQRIEKEISISNDIKPLYEKCMGV